MMTTSEPALRSGDLALLLVDVRSESLFEGSIVRVVSTLPLGPSVLVKPFDGKSPEFSARLTDLERIDTLPYIDPEGEDY